MFDFVRKTPKKNEFSSFEVDPEKDCQTTDCSAGKEKPQSSNPIFFEDRVLGTQNGLSLYREFQFCKADNYRIVRKREIFWKPNP